jgi:hypothetical protein
MAAALAAPLPVPGQIQVQTPDSTPVSLDVRPLLSEPV